MQTAIADANASAAAADAAAKASNAYNKAAAAQEELDHIDEIFKNGTAKEKLEIMESQWADHSDFFTGTKRADDEIVTKNGDVFKVEVANINEVNSVLSDHENRITVLETTVADHDRRIKDLESAVFGGGSSASDANKEDSKADKWEKKMRSKIHQAKKSPTPVYYMTSKGNLIDLRTPNTPNLSLIHI